MGLLKPESLMWADQIENLKGQTPKERRAELQAAYNLSPSQITNLLAIKSCFDQSALDKVRQATQGSSPFTLSFNSAQALSRLKNRANAKDLSTLVHATLDAVLSQRLTTQQIKALVEWIVSGKPAAEFDPHAKVKSNKPLAHSKRGPQLEASARRPPDPSLEQPLNPSLDLKKLRQLLEKAEAERIQGNETAAQDKLEAYIRKLFGASPSSPAGISSLFSKSKTLGKGPQKTTSGEGLSETVVLDWLADISIIAQIKSKVKKGKPVTKGEVVLLWLHKAGELLGHLAKINLKLFKPLFKVIHWVWKLVIEALKELGLYKYARAVFTLVTVAAAIWFAWEAFHYGVMRPVEMVWSKIHIHHEEAVTPELTPVPSPSPAVVPQTPISMGLGQPKRVSRPVVSTQVYQPSVSFLPSVYDPQLLEQEIDAIPPNSLIKAYPLSPEETMPGDLAAGRLQDLTNADKYTMKLGGGTQKVLSVTTSTTNFTLNYKSADALGGFLGGSGQLNFFWEDVKYIHSDEVDIQGKNPSTFYQCSLIVSGSKNALTIQCASADDLNHLVSTMEYFIRHSRLGHDTALAGMPYPHQGLAFNNPCVVEKLWANSPADKAGVGLGDHLWSTGKATVDQQVKKVVESGLDSLPVTLFTASPAEWTKAKIAQGPESNSFRPRLRKVFLGF